MWASKIIEFTFIKLNITMFLSGLDSDSDHDVPKVCLDWHDKD